MRAAAGNRPEVALQGRLSADGAFTIRGVPEDGPWTVTARALENPETVLAQAELGVGAATPQVVLSPAK